MMQEVQIWSSVTMEGGGWDEGEREVQEREDICITMADSCYCIAETNTMF